MASKKQDVFALDVLAAKHGDALILRWGSKKKQRAILIDGGPPGTFKESVRPSLEALRGVLGASDGDPIPLELVMISHLDSDHIKGVLDMFEDEAESRDDGGSNYEIKELWHNTFDDLLTTETAALIQKALPKVEDNSLSAMAASIPEARKVRDLARKLKLDVNSPAKNGLLVAKKGKATKVDFDGLKLSILGPQQPRVETLHKKWDAYLRDLKKKGKLKPAEVAEFIDNSPYNLSSLIVLAELSGRKILLTGDARGDDILEGLANAGLLDKKGKFEVDVFKLPHHGSDRNVSTKMFEQIPATHYVISADGNYDNPDMPTLDMIAEARGKEPYTVHMTYRTGLGGLANKIARYLKKLSPAQQKRVHFRDPKALALTIDL